MVGDDRLPRKYSICCRAGPNGIERMRCAECGGEIWSDDLKDEHFCSKCGLVVLGDHTTAPFVKSHVGGDCKDFLKLSRDCFYKDRASGKVKSVACSFIDRERGYITEPGDLPSALSYPDLCILTFYDIPSIEDPPMPTGIGARRFIVHIEYTDEELADINKMANQAWQLTLPTTAKTIKKYRDGPTNRRGVVPRAHVVYEGTPIGDLLRDHPKVGRAALNSLFSSFLMWWFGHYTSPRDTPTREFMIKSFMKCPRAAGLVFPERDLAEKRFDLLVQYGIIKGFPSYQNSKSLLYYATQKSGPHQIPNEPHANDLEYYLLNNK